MAELPTDPNLYPRIQLELYDVSWLRKEFTRLSQSDHNYLRNFIISLLKNTIGPSISSETTSEKTGHMCYYGLTAKEVVNRIANIEDEVLRKKLCEKVTPFLVSRSSAELQKIFSSEFDFETLDDTKGDMKVQEHSAESHSSKSSISVNYFKCLIRRRGSKYDINLAYYTFHSQSPISFQLTQLRSNEDVKRDLELAKAMASNSLHRRLKAGWPESVDLVEQRALPSDTS